MSGELYVQLNTNHSNGELPCILWCDHLLISVFCCTMKCAKWHCMRLHLPLGLFPAVLLLLWVRLTAGRSHGLSGCSERLRGLWSSSAKVNNRTEWSRVMASSQLKLIKAKLNGDLLQVRRMPGQRRRSGSWWRWLESLSFPHLWGKEYCRMTILTVLLAARSRCAYVSELSFQKRVLMDWCDARLSFSRALLQADVIVLLGARLNWILHFGLPPRFSPHVKIIQVSYTLDTQYVSETLP